MSKSTPVYSSYTGKFIGNGPISWNTPHDAPKEDSNYGGNYGGNYHVITYIPANDTYMAHSHRGRFK